MTTTEFKPKALFLVTKTIYFALIIGLLLFLGVTFLTLDGSTFFRLDLNDPIFIVSIVLTCTAIPLGYYYSIKSSSINSVDPLSKKLPPYQVRLIIRMATCEGSGLFAIVGLLISGNLTFLIPFGAALLVMIFYYPSPLKVGQEIELTQTEIDSLT